MANEYHDVVTPEGRLVFPKLFNAEAAFEGGEPKFSCILVFPKGTDLSGLQGIVKEAFTNKFPKGASNAKNPIQDGNEKVDTWGKAFEDSVFIRLNTRNKPAVVDTDRKYLTEDEVYSGMYARAVVSAYAYDHAGNKGVSLSFSAVQITREGEKLGYDPSMSVNKFDKIEGGFKTKDPFANADQGGAASDPFGF